MEAVHRKNSPNPEEPKRIVATVKEFQAEIRDEVRRQLLERSSEELSQVVAEGAGDVSYKIDVSAEPFLEGLGQQFSKECPVAIIAEGLGRRHFTEGSKPELEIINDPIDGTRGIMYDMRSAWVLTGIAPSREEGANLQDIQIAVQTEIPITKQDKVSVLWAIKGQGAFEEIWDLREGKLITQRRLQASKATDLRHGSATFVDFFPGSKEELNKLAETVFEKVLGPVEKGKALAFDDQYISSAGQIYLLATGKYRFVADLRPVMEKVLNRKGRQLGLTAHPYDLSTVLIAQEAGVIITNENGQPPSYPLDTETNCSWIGYANEAIRQKVEPVLLEELKKLT